MSWHGVDRWTRAEERKWLCTLSPTQLAGYIRTLPFRAVDFAGQPVTLEFLRDCRLDAARALERGTVPPPEEAPDGE